jgi:exopolyphosphatase/guanosine-5'-triphosphate,3'-diphosphate pyrophosphatase
VTVDAGTLLVTLADDEIVIELIGGGSWTLPVGPVSITDRELERADRPAPEQLTNGLGIVTDHLDDVVRDSPMVLNATDVVVSGAHALSVARVEFGTNDVPSGYRLRRVDADDVFRTLVAEPIAERLHNPGLEATAVETVIGSLCCILSVMRRLELTDVAIVGPPG